MAPDARARIVLGAGALAGLAVALLGLLSGPEVPAIADEDVVALVNGTPIARADFERAMQALETDRRVGDVTGDRGRLLDRLIDEELLLQHALGLGLARGDPRVRGQLVRSIIDAIVAEAEAEVPSEATLRQFYGEHREFFARPGRRRVRRAFVRGTDEAARARAAEIRTAIEAGTDAAGLGDPIVPVPDVLLPVAKLEQYLGPTLAAAARRLSVGAVSAPIVSAGGLHVLHVVAAEAAEVPAFESIREVVASEQRRRAGEAALRRYLEGLRDDAVIARSDLE